MKRTARAAASTARRGCAAAVQVSRAARALAPSVMFGLVYLGAAVYFLHGYLRPRWGNAIGQLAGFLAYDLVLLAPLLERLGIVTGVRLTSLVVYLAVVLYSGALAVHHLLLAEPTRIRVR